MKIKKVHELTESKMININKETILYRITSHPVIDLSSPGKYYFSEKSKVDTSVLKNKDKGDFFIIKVRCDADNIDINLSAAECAKNNNDYIVMVRDESKLELISVEPYQKNK
jgi:hypothetical protein